MVWERDPDSGGEKITEAVKKRTTQRVLQYAEKHFAGKFIRLDIRFRQQFCYIDMFTDEFESEDDDEEERERSRNFPIHLCRLRYFGNEDAWAFAMYGYSNEKYDLTMLPGGSFYCKPEEAFDVVARLHFDEA